MTNDSTLTIDPIDLAVAQREDGFWEICYGKECIPLKSFLGDDFTHPTYTFLKQCVDEFDGLGELKIHSQRQCLTELWGPSSYVLESLRLAVDFNTQKKRDDRFAALLAEDQLFNWVPGPESVEQLGRTHEALDWVNTIATKSGESGPASDETRKLLLSDLRSSRFGRFAKAQIVPGYHTKEDLERSKLAFEHYFNNFLNCFRDLDIYDQISILFLGENFNSATISFYCIAIEADPANFARTAGAASAILSPIFDHISDDDQRESFREAKEAFSATRVWREYASRRFDNNTLDRLIAKDESKTCELKSSLRYDFKEKKQNKYLIHSSLKTIAAFANSEGGHLLVGVSDDKEIVGIEPDGFGSNDKWGNYLTNQVRDFSSTLLAELLSISYETSEGKTVALINVKASSTPIYLNDAKGEEHLYVRTTASTRSLKTSEIADYVANRFE